tara:strand:- start:47594 stop:47929 length:336 start_codon:yes stop_codon:yes gene_type:complete
MSLTEKKCVPCEGGVGKFDAAKVKELLQQLHSDWQVNADSTIITRKFEFKGFYKTMAFVNALAWIANQEMHHPDFSVTYNSCTINFTTHAINGLSENDFICAAKVDALLAN